MESRDKEKDYPIPLMIIGMFSSAAFVIEHPDRAGDFDAVQLAGVEGALKAYEAALKQEPEARLEFLDELLEKQKKGELPKQVRKLTKNCR